MLQVVQLAGHHCDSEPSLRGRPVIRQRERDDNRLVKSRSTKRNKRRAQRYRSAIGLNGSERSFGLDVRIRDFSSEAVAVETPA